MVPKHKLLVQAYAQEVHNPYQNTDKYMTS